MAGKAELLSKLDLPDKQIPVDEVTEMWEYKLHEDTYTSATGYRFSTFDRLTLTLKKGKLDSWKEASQVQ
jgi:hypothetical protein